MLRFLVILGLLVALATSAPSLRFPSLSYPNRRSIDDDPPLPILELDYGKYQAHHYDEDNDVRRSTRRKWKLLTFKIYTFQNIRFGAPPIGDLRWAKPVPPALNTTTSDGNYGYQCVQGPVTLAVLPGISSVATELQERKESSEDCLFLDLLVPGKALKAPDLSKLPVIVWVFGGAFTLGSKNRGVDGTGLIRAANGSAIFVAGNYRVSNIILFQSCEY
jgi:Carboxylesterase family